MGGLGERDGDPLWSPAVLVLGTEATLSPLSETRTSERQVTSTTNCRTVRIVMVFVPSPLNIPMFQLTRGNFFCRARGCVRLLNTSFFEPKGPGTLICIDAEAIAVFTYL